MFTVRASGEAQAPLGAARYAVTAASRQMPLLAELEKGVRWAGVSINMALLAELSRLPGTVKYSGQGRAGGCLAGWCP